MFPDIGIALYISVIENRRIVSGRRLVNPSCQGSESGRRVDCHYVIWPTLPEHAADAGAERGFADAALA